MHVDGVAERRHRVPQQHKDVEDVVRAPGRSVGGPLERIREEAGQVGEPDGGVRNARRAEGQQDHVPKEEDVLHPQRRLDDRLGGADRAVSAAIEAKSGGGDGGGGGSGEPGEGGERGRPTKVARPEQEGGGQHQRDAYKIAPQPRHLALRPLRGGAVGVAQVAVVVAVGEENVERGGDSDEQPDGCATRPRLEESDGAKVHRHRDWPDQQEVSHDRPAQQRSLATAVEVGESPGLAHWRNVG
mmetsp:Transcript_16175/g.46602  ORF Transcript_16175/g.46602 Transcript_16175/m.46602 type:complete len:243 (+) Transcript_16175:168-896(+)